MVRLLGANLPDSKKLWRALTRIYGVGDSRAKAMCFAIGATPHVKAGDLRPHHLSQLYNYAEKNYLVGQELKRTTRENIQRLVDIRCYRGFRHLENLPVRGQRSHTNARTQKKLNRARFIRGPERPKSAHPRFQNQSTEATGQTSSK